MKYVIDTPALRSWRSWAVVVAAVCSTAEMPPIPERARAGLDRALGIKGVYVSEESAHTFTFPRSDVALRIDGHRLTPGQSPKSWATFSPSMHREAMVNGELVLLGDEVNPVITVALKSGLQVTGLGGTLLDEQPRLFVLNVTAEGTFQTLGDAFRKPLDEVRRIRSEKRDGSAGAGAATAPMTNAIDPNPLNAILSMRGMAANGIYRAAIGRVALVNGTPIGREMGMSTKVSMFGTNDRAFLDADMMVSAEELQRVLLALRTRNLNISSIRNHFVGEHPQFIFIRVWGQGPAVDLARGFRYALDAGVGAGRPAAAQ